MNVINPTRRRWLTRLLGAGLVALGLGASTLAAQAQDMAPDAAVKRLSTDLLDAIKADKQVQGGDMNRLMQLVDTKLMPNVNFQRMTASAAGPAWRRATPEQQKRLQEEFKTLLVRTYAGAVSKVSDKELAMLPFRGSASEAEALVRTQVKGNGDPVQLDYRLEKTPGQGYGWKLYDVNVMGIWLVDNYRSQFAQEINAKGMDGLIASLAERNQANAARK